MDEITVAVLIAELSKHDPNARAYVMNDGWHEEPSPVTGVTSSVELGTEGLPEAEQNAVYIEFNIE